jgi:uncharacterized membrane protein
MKRIIFLTFTLLIFAFRANADNIQFTASAPKVVAVGEQFEVTYTITAQPSGFKPPEFKNFNLIGGPSTSSSSSVQFINGKVIQNSTYSYTYYFTANSPGAFAVEPAKATVDGKAYLSNAFSVEVVGNAKQGGNPQGNKQNAQQNNQQGNKREIVAESGNDDIFVRVIIDRNSLYQGEHLIATIKLFSKLNISAIENVEYPAFTGFFRQDIETPPLRALEKENINGQIYATGVIQKMALFPQKSGEIIIDPFTLQCVVQMQVKGRQRSIFDDFWGPQVQESRKKIKSTPLKVTVKPLPYGATASFHGAVGNFTMKAAVDKTDVKTNDAISLKVTVSGNGNIKMIEPFDIKFPTDFETYDPKVAINASTTANGVAGSKTFEYLIIPRHSGNFKIPAIEFTYFDTQLKQYKTLSSNEIDIAVQRGANESATTVVSGVSKEDVKFIGKDIQYIKNQVPDFKKKGEFIFGSIQFWMYYIVSLVVFVILVIFWRNRIRENANILIVRNKRANKVARKRLQDAHLHMRDNKSEEFYEYILKALWGYMSDKLSIPVSELSRDKVKDEIGNRNIDDQLVQQFMHILDTCEFARYAPSESPLQMEHVYNEAISVITKIEQNIK